MRETFGFTGHHADRAVGVARGRYVELSGRCRHEPDVADDNVFADSLVSHFAVDQECDLERLRLSTGVHWRNRHTPLPGSERITRLAGGDFDGAIGRYARGYYYEAKRLGLLEVTGLKS